MSKQKQLVDDQKKFYQDYRLVMITDMLTLIKNPQHVIKGAKTNGQFTGILNSLLAGTLTWMTCFFCCCFDVWLLYWGRVRFLGKGTQLIIKHCSLSALLVSPFSQHSEQQRQSFGHFPTEHTSSSPSLSCVWHDHHCPWQVCQTPHHSCNSQTRSCTAHPCCAICWKIREQIFHDFLKRKKSKSFSPDLTHLFCQCSSVTLCRHARRGKNYYLHWLSSYF